MITIVIPGERPKSLNDWYSGGHWSKRATEAKRVHELVQGYMLEMGIRQGDFFTQPVTITMIAYFDKRMLDASNIVLKVYEDALKGWIIKDDSPTFVRGVSAYSMEDKKNPRVEIVVKEIER